jgi:hypothetical protein
MMANFSRHLEYKWKELQSRYTTKTDTPPAAQRAVWRRKCQDNYFVLHGEIESVRLLWEFDDFDAHDTALIHRYNVALTIDESCIGAAFASTVVQRYRNMYEGLSIVYVQ